MNVKHALIAAILFAPALAFGADQDATSFRVALVNSILDFVIDYGFMVGLALMVAAGYKMKLAVDEGSKVGGLQIALTFIVAAIFMNIEAALTTITNTYFKVDFCRIIAEERISDTCFSEAYSGITGELRERINRLSGDSTAQMFMDNIRVLTGVFQIIGFIYFLVGAYGLIQVSKGSSQDSGYGKPIITMIASALIVDVPHTVQVALNTLNGIGINF